MLGRRELPPHLSDGDRIDRADSRRGFLPSVAGGDTTAGGDAADAAAEDSGDRKSPLLDGDLIDFDLLDDVEFNAACACAAAAKAARVSHWSMGDVACWRASSDLESPSDEPSRPLRESPLLAALMACASLLSLWACSHCRMTSSDSFSASSVL